MKPGSDFLLFGIGKKTFCIGVEHIKNVAVLERLTILPNSHAEIAGLVNVRGEVAVCVELAQLLGFQSGKQDNLIVLREKLALLVDWIGNVEGLSKAKRSIRPKGIRFIKRAMKLENKRILELDVHDLLDLELVSNLYSPIPLPEHAPRNQLFNFKDGHSVSTLWELTYHLKELDEAVFNHHINKQKNDVANWIEHVFHNNELADSVRECTTRQALIALLSEKALP